MEKRKKILKISLFFIIALGFFVTSPLKASAANPQKAILKTNRTYTAYDITGDRKKDSLRINIYKNSKYDYYDSLNVKINGKTAYSFKNKYFYANTPYEGIQIRYFTLKNGTPFLYLYAQAENGDGPVCGVFQYKNGKLYQIINFQTLFQGYGAHLNGNVISVNGNSITTEFYIMSYVLGPCQVRFNYAYKNGTLKRTSPTANFTKIYSYGKPTKTFYANKTLTAYSTPAATKKAFSVKRGAAVVVDKCYMSSGRMLVRIKYNGKYGWIKAVKGYPGESNKQFSNATYAG